MKFSVVLMSLFFSSHAMAYRLDAETYFYVGKGVSIVNPYYEESDGTRYPINVRYLIDRPTPELLQLCSMYTNAPIDQVQANAFIGEGDGMLYSVQSGGFSPVPLPNTYDSIYILMCYSDQHPSVPFGGKTTHSSDGSMTVESPTVEFNGEDYPIILAAEETMDDFCRMLGYSSFDSSNFSLNHHDQGTKAISLEVELKNNKFYFTPDIKTSGVSPFLLVESFTCKP